MGVRGSFFRGWGGSIASGALGMLLGAGLCLAAVHASEGPAPHKVPAVLAAAAVQVPAKPAAPVGYIQTKGTPEDQYVREYSCASGYASMYLPIGNSAEMDGTVISLTAKKTGPNSFDDQTSVLVKAKLGLHRSLAAVIVKTGAHQHFPELYPESVITPAIGHGGATSFTLISSAYANNYQNEGIIGVTFCLGS